ncbi:hypothetical protein NDA13_003491 [Ustilago tritici]|nr:hypothetical protein NDA13_003491 [Ustilago tritici]
MLNPDYSLYEYFVELIQDLTPHLPDMVQGRFHHLINNKTYSTLKESKVGLVFWYTSGVRGKQVVKPLTIMIECVSTLYYVMHQLSPFHNLLNLERQMRVRVTFSITNEKWDATHIIDLMIEYPMDLEAELDVALSEGPMDFGASDLEEELDVASSEGGNVVQDSTTDEAPNVAQMLTTTSKLDGTPTPTASEFTFDPIATAGDGLIITGPSSVNAMTGHHGLSTSSSAI